MESLKILFLLTILMATLVALSSAQSKHGSDGPNIKQEAQQQQTINTYHGSPSPYLKPKQNPSYDFPPWAQPRAHATCDRFPRICHAKGSPGPDCCWKKCVNVKIDNFNCGRCGHRCKYSEICCNGRCVNPLYDRNHCGGCFNNCGKGNFCYYGMCSYA